MKEEKEKGKIENSGDINKNESNKNNPKSNQKMLLNKGIIQSITKDEGKEVGKIKIKKST